MPELQVVAQRPSATSPVLAALPQRIVTRELRCNPPSTLSSACLSLRLLLARLDALEAAPVRGQ